MSKIKGTNITAPIVPLSTNDNYPTHLAKYGKGGYISVVDIEERDCIPEERLEEGMLVYVKNDETGIHYYQYLNGNWEESNIGQSSTLLFSNSDPFNARVEDGKVVVYNEKATEPIDEEQSKYLRINSFYVGKLGKLPNKHDFLPCSHYFIELSNIGFEDIPLEGIKLRQTITVNSVNYTEDFELTGIIKAGSTYLVRGPQCSILNAPTTIIKINQYNQLWESMFSIIPEEVNIRSIQFNLTLLFGNERLEDIYILGDNTGGIEDAAKGNISNKIFVRRYPLDPCQIDDRTNTTILEDYNSMVNWRWHYIEDQTYQPAASYEGKNIVWGNDWFKEDKPTTVTCTVGKYAETGKIGYATRCITWTSLGLEDEYVWIRRKNAAQWEYRILSISGENGGDAFNRLQEKSQYADGELNPSYYIYNNDDIYYYYDRLMWETLNGDVITTHRSLVDIYFEGTFEYICGRADENGNPTSYVSDIKEFTIYSDENGEKHSLVNIGNLNIGNREEANLWKAISNKLLESYGNDTEDSKYPAFITNTGNLVKNGTRPYEWIYYINNNALSDHFAEFITPGPNDLGEIKLYEVGTEKYNYSMMDLFYTFDLGEVNYPIIELPEVDNSEAMIRIKLPGLYSTWYGKLFLISVNSTIITNLEDPTKKDTLRNVMRVSDIPLVDQIPGYNEKLGIMSTYYNALAIWIYNELMIASGESPIESLTTTLPIEDEGFIRTDFSSISAVILSNRAPIEIYSDTIQRDPSDISSDLVRSDDVQYDNLNKRINFLLSRLFKTWKINKIISQSDLACGVSYPIFDAPYDFNPEKLEDSWYKYLIQNKLETFDTFIPVLCSNDLQEIRNLLIDSIERTFWNCTDNTIYLDTGREFPANTRNDNKDFPSERYGEYSLIGSSEETAPKYVYHQTSLLSFGTEEDNSTTITNSSKWLKKLDTRYADYMEFGPGVIQLDFEVDAGTLNITHNSVVGFLDNRDSRLINNLWNEEVMKNRLPRITIVTVNSDKI